MENSTGSQRPEHGGDLFKILLPYPFAIVLFLAEGLDFMQAGQAVLELGIQFAHAFLGSLEVGTYDFGEDHTGAENQGNGAAGDQRQFPVDGQKNNQHAGESHHIGDDFGNHMGVQQLKIPGIVDHPAHQIAGLLVMEES